MASWAVIKRLYECTSVDPDFARDLASDTRTMLERIRVDIEADEAMELIGKMSIADRSENPYFGIYLPKAKRIGEETDRRLERDKYVSRDMYEVGRITRNRMCVENRLIRLHNNIRYFPIVFDLARGCSVGCPFCGFDAPGLSGLFRYTDENAALWKGVLHAAKVIIGEAAVTGACYFATEPFDNPDYELFIKDYHDILGHIPQTTTAVAERDPERLKSFISSMEKSELENAAIRISIRTKEQFYKIMSEFSPEELEETELLPNNPESVNRYSLSGRARQDGADGVGYSISCLAGLRVNMTEKSIVYEEPEIPCDDFPTGERIYDKVYFTDERSFKEAANRLMGECASAEIRNDDVLLLSHGVSVKTDGNKAVFTGDASELTMTGDNMFIKSVSMLTSNGISLTEIGDRLGVSGFVLEMICGKMQMIHKGGYLRRIPEKYFKIP